MKNKHKPLKPSFDEVPSKENKKGTNTSDLVWPENSKRRIKDNFIFLTDSELNKAITDIMQELNCLTQIELFKKKMVLSSSTIF